MELAIIGGIAIVAIVALFKPSAMTSTESALMPQGAGGNVSGITGPAVQLLQEQPSSTAGQSGSGSMGPTGMLPPVATGVRILPPQPVRVPVNVAPAPRPFRPTAPMPPVNFMGTKTPVTFHR